MTGVDGAEGRCGEGTPTWGEETLWRLPEPGRQLCRSIGKTDVTMNVSIVVNVINVAGNCVGVFVLYLGAAGVAWPSLLSRILSAAAVTVYCFRPKNPVRYRWADIWTWDGGLLKKSWASLCPTAWKTAYTSW